LVSQIKTGIKIEGEGGKKEVGEDFVGEFHVLYSSQDITAMKKLKEICGMVPGSIPGPITFSEK
jgi:hypothetical protein